MFLRKIKTNHVLNDVGSDTGCPTKHDRWWIVLNVFFHINWRLLQFILLKILILNYILLWNQLYYNNTTSLVHSQLWMHVLLENTLTVSHSFSQFFTVFHSFLQFFTVFHSFSQFFTVFHSFLQFFTVFYSFSQFFTVFHSFSQFFTVFHSFSKSSRFFEMSLHKYIRDGYLHSTGWFLFHCRFQLSHQIQGQTKNWNEINFNIFKSFVSEFWIMLGK